MHSHASRMPIFRIIRLLFASAHATILQSYERNVDVPNASEACFGPSVCVARGYRAYGRHCHYRRPTQVAL